MMKKIILSLLSLMVASHLLAQTPQAINYQTVVRDNGGAALANQNISFRLSILDSVTAVSIAYSETHSVRTNAYGLATLMIGRGTNAMGSFSAINWAIGTKFLRVEADFNQSGSYTNLGTQQFLSVPYALYAERAGNGGATSNDWALSGNVANNNNILGTLNNQDLRFVTNNTQRMTLKPNGALGLGTNTPNARLHIEGFGEGFSDTDDRTFLRIHNTSDSRAAISIMAMNCGVNTNYSTFLSHHSLNYQFWREAEGYGQLWNNAKGLLIRASPSSSSTNLNGNIRFYTGYNPNDNYETSFERLRIEYNGNIGINTKTPKAKLEIAQGDIYLNNIDQSQGIIMRSPNGNCWRITIDNNGNFVRTSINCPQ